ncbi:EamA family transporter RarD [Leifsonia shinshuensis]|uniref:EamA family transporter RarD n=1 Tax=Leifsonia shinshuensis TaxID=150026 RepID=UPI001F506057|nr:EamA family transporter RarD [Leifsonia shinshuensis]MCI0159145.1 EamA family transporter RarD [Leifsonia shinshuensis]
MAPPSASAEHRASGLIFAISAHVLWGVLTLYFIALAPTTAWEIVAWRVIFSLVFCALLLTVTRAWRPFALLLRSPRILFTMALAGALIYVNWQTYVLATVTGHVVEAALGYFINPIVTVLLGVIVQHERLRPAQWVAVGLSAVAVVVLAVGYGAFPWIALLLAFSFGFYGLIKKRVGPSVDAVSGLTLETMWLTPIAVVQLIVVALTSGITLGEYGAWHTIALAGAGVVTAVPLLFFAAASRRLPLVYMGFVQYVTPLIQFLVGVFVLHEAMPPERWVGFGIVWLALIVLSVDMVAAARTGRRVAQLA